jgi:hypothetical protein
MAQSKQSIDFTFLLGHRRSDCLWLITDFLSRPIPSLHASDPTINLFELETEDLHNPFSEFLILGHSHLLIITEPDRSFLRSIAHVLEIVEVSVLGNNLFDDDFTVSAFCKPFQAIKASQCAFGLGEVIGSLLRFSLPLNFPF